MTKQQASQIAEAILRHFEQMDRIEAKLDDLLRRDPQVASDSGLSPVTFGKAPPGNARQESPSPSEPSSERSSDPPSDPSPQRVDLTSPRPHNKERNISDQRYYNISRGVIRSLLQEDAPAVGKLTMDLCRELGENDTTFRVALKKLCEREGFITMSNVPRGQAPFVRLRDPEAARRWLAEAEGRTFDSAGMET